MPLPRSPASGAAELHSLHIAGPVRVSSAVAGRSRTRERPAGIAMSALAAGESVASGLRHSTSSGASALALPDGTHISFSRITEDSSLEPA